MNNKLELFFNIHEIHENTQIALLNSKDNDLNLCNKDKIKHAFSNLFDSNNNIIGKIYIISNNFNNTLKNHELIQFNEPRFITVILELNNLGIISHSAHYFGFLGRDNKNNSSEHLIKVTERNSNALNIFFGKELHIIYNNLSDNIWSVKIEW
jgi:hypothetical protein